MAELFALVYSCVARPWPDLSAVDFKTCLQQLLQSNNGEHQIHLEILGPKGKTALRVGVESLPIEYIRVLLECGASPNAVIQSALEGASTMHPTCLQYAVFHGRHEVAQLLLEYGALVNWTGGKSAALHLAACTGNLAIATLLLNHQASVDLRDMLGRSALHLAALQGHLDIVSLLVARGADTNATDHRGMKPVDTARGAGNGRKPLDGLTGAMHLKACTTGAAVHHKRFSMDLIYYDFDLRRSGKK